MVRKIARRTAINRQRRSRMRQAIRHVETALAQKNHPAAVEALQKAQPHIMRAAQKNILHKKTAQRKISRLARRVMSLTTAP